MERPCARQTDWIDVVSRSTELFQHVGIGFEPDARLRWRDGIAILEANGGNWQDVPPQIGKLQAVDGGESNSGMHTQLKRGIAEDQGHATIRRDAGAGQRK